MNHPERILILGAYGTGNLGDELILDSLIRLLGRAYPACEVRVLSYDPAVSGRFHRVSFTRIPPYVTLRGGISALLRGRWRWFSNVRDSRRAVGEWIDWCDLFVLGGGNLLTDHPFYFLEHFTGQIVRRAAQEAKTIAVLGAGLGPIGTSKGQRLLEELAGWTTAAALRETAGAEAFAAAGFPHPRVSGDPVLLEPPFSDQALAEPASRALVSLRPLGSNDAFPEHVLRAVQAVGKKMEVAGIAMHPALDEPVLSAHIGASSVVDAPTPARLVAEVRRSTLVLGMRLHACVVAAAHGVPLIPIAYHHKVAAFARTLGVEPLAIDVAVSTREVDALVTAAVDALDSGRQDLIARVQDLRRNGLQELDAALRALPFDPPEPLVA